MSTATKLSLLIFSLLFFAPGAFAQSQQPELPGFNQRRIKLNKQGMLVLGSWATANILAGSLLAGRTQGKQRHFHQMNAYWNTINLAIAGFGYYQATQEIPESMTLGATVQEQYGIQQILLFNAGLDLAYIAGGIYLMEKGRNHSSQAERLQGFGQSIILQGGFLFVFDLSLYLLHQGHQTDLQQLLGHFSVSSSGIGFKWSL